MKTKVRITQKQHQGAHKVGDEGYIDGYLTAADGRPYAVVVCGSVIDLMPVWNMEVIK